METSKYSVFLDNYNAGMNQFLNKLSEAFFTRIQFDKDTVIHKTKSEFIKGKLRQIDSLQINEKDNFSKLKITGKILLDVAGDILSSDDAEVKRSGVNIINSFFDVAKQSEDEELLNTAAAISALQA